MTKPALLLHLVLVLPLTACQATKTLKTGTESPEPLVCTQWLPISYASRHDTSLTIGEIRRSNARREAYCAAG